MIKKDIIKKLLSVPKKSMDSRYNFKLLQRLGEKGENHPRVKELEREGWETCYLK